MRGIVYCSVSWVLLSVYGGMVCPVIDAYPLWKWSAFCLGGYAGMALARLLLEPRLVLAARPRDRSPRQLWMELALTLLVSLEIGLAAFFAAGAPLENALKAAAGALLLGLFFSLELSLRREREALVEAARSGGQEAWTGGSYLPLTTKFAAVAAAALILGTVAVSAVVIKDIFILFYASSDPEWDMSIRAVVADILYVMGVLLSQGLLCLVSYAGNLKLYFNFQTQALERVARDDLDAAVPVVTRDEFGLIAARTNQMIDGLRDRRRVKEIFGKLVSPGIAARLLGPDGRGASLGGERLDAVVLFADVRGFTGYSEKTPPEEVVAGLNSLFTRMVAAVHARGGMVDKFMGDSLMAVFGLDGSPGAGEAVVAALDMAAGSGPFRVGVGVHAGPVVAGNIGSPERLEYTVVGDTVNVASRLQDATKELGVSVAISGAVWSLLPGSAREGFTGLGAVALRGHGDKVEVFGASPESMVKHGQTV